ADLHPWMRPLPLAGASDPAEARRTATALETHLRRCRAVLVDHPVNAGRRRRGLPTLDVLTTKWAGRRGPLPAFEARTGLRRAREPAPPSAGGLVRSCDPTPLVVAGRTVRPGAVPRVGEAPAAAGAYGRLRAADLLPLLAGHANRPALLGHRPSPWTGAALPD